MDRLQELVRLHRMETGPCEVARLLGLSRTTERQYRTVLAGAGFLEGAPDAIPPLETLKAVVEAALPPKRPPQSTTSLERWLTHVEELIGRGLGARAVYDRLRLDHADFDGTYWSVKRLVRRLRRDRGVRAEEVAIPVETRPGEVAQVDFGEIGRLWDPALGRLRRAWVFVMVLGHSRTMVARIVFDQKVETWVRLHVEAFAELGGVPEVVVPDNLKAAVVRAAFGVGGVTALNRSYRELARHYGFKVDPAPVRQPKKKGKVESGVRYVKRNGLAGLASNADLDAAAAHLARWVEGIANQRIHGTTQRRPAEVFAAEERSALMPLPAVPFVPVIWHEAGVHQDAHVAFGGRLYSVPWRLIKQRVWLRASAHTVDVYADDERVATHDRRGRSLRATRDEHLPPERAPLRHRSPRLLGGAGRRSRPRDRRLRPRGLRLGRCAVDAAHRPGDRHPPGDVSAGARRRSLPPRPPLRQPHLRRHQDHLAPGPRHAAAARRRDLTRPARSPALRSRHHRPASPDQGGFR